MSLMQMAKPPRRWRKCRSADCRTSPVLTDPTMGGVSASFAMLGDLNIAEPKALIGFCRSSRYRADRTREAAAGIPAQRVPD